MRLYNFNSSLHRIYTKILRGRAQLRNSIWLKIRQILFKCLSLSKLYWQNFVNAEMLAGRLKLTDSWWETLSRWLRMSSELSMSPCLPQPLTSVFHMFTLYERNNEEVSRRSMRIAKVVCRLLSSNLSRFPCYHYTQLSVPVPWISIPLVNTN